MTAKQAFLVWVVMSVVYTIWVVIATHIEYLAGGARWIGNLLSLVGLVLIGLVGNIYIFIKRSNGCPSDYPKYTKEE